MYRKGMRCGTSAAETRRTEVTKKRYVCMYQEQAQQKNQQLALALHQGLGCVGLAEREGDFAGVRWACQRCPARHKQCVHELKPE